MPDRQDGEFPTYITMKKIVHTECNIGDSGVRSTAQSVLRSQQ